MKKREGYRVIIFEPAKTRILNNQCPACGLSKEKYTRRKDWRCCSIKCTEKYHKMYVAYGWPDFRLKVFKRDNYSCVKCGRSPSSFKRRYEGENDKDFKWRAETYDKEVFVRYLGKGYEVYDTSMLIGDHIKPIALGGDEWDLNNIQTLCISCNKIKTSEDIKKIAKQRKIEKINSKENPLFPL